MLGDDLRSWKERRRPIWLAYLIGGNYRVHCEGGFAYCWRPSLAVMTQRYFREKWWRAGYTLFGWLIGSKSHGHGRGGVTYRIRRR